MNCKTIAGIDCGRDSFALTLLDGASKNRIFSKVFSNTEAGFKKVLKILASKKVDLGDVLFCIENVGVYADKLSHFLDRNGAQVMIADPQKVKRTARDQGHKTDLVDSVCIAEYVLRFPDRLKPFVAKSPVIEGLETLFNLRRTLTKQATVFKNQLRSLKLKEHPPAAAILITEKMINTFTAQIRDLGKEIDKLLAKDSKLTQGVTILKSIPGVGDVVAVATVVYFYRNSSLPSYRQAASHLGIAPREYSSGSSVFKPARSRQHGPSAMRQLLYLSALSAKRYSPRSKRYYELKKAQGKHGSVIMNNLCNRQLKLMLTLLRNKKPYVEDYISVHPRHLTLS